MIIEQLIKLRIKLPTISEAAKNPAGSAEFIKAAILNSVPGCEPFGDKGVQLTTAAGATYKIGFCENVPDMVKTLREYNRLANNTGTTNYKGRVVSYKQFCS